MSNKPKPSMAGEDLLKTPLYVYDLPEILLSSLTQKSDHPTSAFTPTSSTSAIQANNDDYDDGKSTDSSTTLSTNCTLCSVMNRTVQEQRAHVRSDLHKFNAKRRVRGLKVVTEEEFERLIEEEGGGLGVESISGSEESEEQSEEDEGGRLKEIKEEGEGEREGQGGREVRKGARGVNPRIGGVDNDGEGDMDEKSAVRRGSPLIWFTSPLLPQTVSLGIYRALFPVNHPASDLVPFLRTNQYKPIKPLPPTDPTNTAPPPQLQNPPPHIFLCMIGGGHFAAMVIALPPVAGSSSKDRSATVLAHKTFHRYTTRRKQGGAQSTNDSAKGKANSAGAQIRRYNEAELQREIRELLAGWKEQWIDTAELLFVRAAGNVNRRALFFYEGAVLRQKDERMRGFPFSTRRATQSELMRAFVELTRVKVSHEHTSSSSLANQSTTLQSTFTTKPNIPTKPSKQEQLLLDHTSTLTTLIRRQKIPPLLTYLAASSLSPNFPFHPPSSHHHAPTPLHLAASLNSPLCVSALLLQAGADPTITNSEGKTPFEIAGDRATRDAFRIARMELGEETWDWGDTGAKVPGGLTREDVERREKEEREEKEREEQKERERRRKEVERLKKEELTGKGKSAAAGKTVTLGVGSARGVNVLGGGGGNGMRVRTGEDLAREREVAGMSPEMRAKLERERRARAAEERIRKLQQVDAGGTR